MAIQKIDYAQKAPFQTNENVPETNQCTADDMNEIKETVNNNADELTTAQQNIENLQTGQGTASGDITSLKNRVTTLETDNTTNKQDISSLKSRTTTLETDNETNKQNIANKVDKVEGKGLSTEDYTTGEKQKLAGLNNYDDTAIKKEIQELDDNQIHITTEKSDNLNVKDASGQNAKINAFGISKQETRSGKNKFNIDNLINVTEQNVQTGSFVASSLYGTTIINNINLVNLLKPNTNYKCIANVTLLEKPATITSNIANMLTLYKSIAPANNIPVLKCSNTTEKNNWQVNETKQLETTFTTDNDLSLYNMLCYCYANDTEVAGKFKFENIMILEATEQDKTFEQYGASPSPEYPSEIENVTGDIDITVCNKNLFNNTKTISNVTYNSEEDKWIFNLPNRYDHIAQKGTFFKNIKANTNYTLYFNILKNTSSAAILFNLTNTIWNNNIQILAGQTGVITNNIKTKEDLSSALYDLWFSHSNAITGEFEAQIMICEGSETDNNYVKYQEQLITFPLAEGQKLYDKDYPASDGIHHVREQIELDGTENWLQFASVNQFYITLNNSKADNNQISCISTHYKAIAFNTRNAGSDKECAVSESGVLAIFTKDYATVEEFKTYLAEQKTAETPVILEYELEEEEIEPYTEEQQEAYNKLQNVLSYKTETNVFTDKAQLVFKYIADTQTWVLNKLNNTNQQILELAGGK